MVVKTTIQGEERRNELTIMNKNKRKQTNKQAWRRQSYIYTEGLRTYKGSDDALVCVLLVVVETV